MKELELFKNKSEEVNKRERELEERKWQKMSKEENEQYKKDIVNNKIGQTECKILLNNLKCKMFEIFKNDEELQKELKKYSFKNIGTKTQEKIRQAIQDAYKKQGINARGYIDNFAKSYRGTELKIYLLTNEGFTWYGTDIDIVFETPEENTSEEFKGVPSLYAKMQYIENPKEQALYFLRKEEKAKQQIEALKSAIETMKNDFNNEIISELYNDMHIGTITIY